GVAVGGGLDGRVLPGDLAARPYRLPAVRRRVHGRAPALVGERAGLRPRDVAVPALPPGGCPARHPAPGAAAPVSTTVVNPLSHCNRPTATTLARKVVS